MVELCAGVALHELVQLEGQVKWLLVDLLVGLGVLARVSGVDLNRTLLGLIATVLGKLEFVRVSIGFGDRHVSFAVHDREVDGLFCFRAALKDYVN